MTPSTRAPVARRAQHLLTGARGRCLLEPRAARRTSTPQTVRALPAGTTTDDRALRRRHGGLRAPRRMTPCSELVAGAGPRHHHGPVGVTVAAAQIRARTTALRRTGPASVQVRVALKDPNVTDVQSVTAALATAVDARWGGEPAVHPATGGLWVIVP